MQKYGYLIELTII